MCLSFPHREKSTCDLTLPQKSWVHLDKQTEGWALGNIAFFFQWRIQYQHIPLQWPTRARQQQAEGDREGDVIRRSDPQICNATITIHNNWLHYRAMEQDPRIRATQWVVGDLLQPWGLTSECIWGSSDLKACFDLVCALSWSPWDCWTSSLVWFCFFFWLLIDKLFKFCFLKRTEGLFGHLWK